jgi:hypothetical protein
MVYWASRLVGSCFIFTTQKSLGYPTTVNNFVVRCLFPIYVNRYLFLILNTSFTVCFLHQFHITTDLLNDIGA